MTKISEVESDLLQFKQTVEVRFDKLEAALESLRADQSAAATTAAAAAEAAEKRHTDLLAMMARQSQPQPTSFAPSPHHTADTAPPSSRSSQHPPITQTFVPFVPPSYDRYGRPLPFQPMTDTIAQPPPSTLPLLPHHHRRPPPSTIPVTTTIHSSRIFDEYGFPIASDALPYSAPEMHSSTSVVDRPHPLSDDAGHRPDYPYSDPHAQPLSSGPSGEQRWLPGADYRLRKLKMPLFDGADAYGWVYRLERFFDMQGLVATGERLRAAVLCMEGQALSWFRWTDRRTPFRCWEHLRVALLDRFQPSYDGDLYEQFLTIRQEGSARDYVSLFESMAAQLDGISEKILSGTFLKGLRPDLRASVRVSQPATLGQSMRWAIMMDESSGGAISSTPKQTLKGGPSRPGLTQQLRPAAAPSQLEGGRPALPATRQPFKRLTEAEIADRKAKGLCFRCDARYAPGHRCPEKSLKLLFIPEGEEESEGELEEPEEVKPVQLDVVEVSAQSVVGITNPQTMKLRGRLGDHDVVVLIDSGATHNFLSIDVVKQLGLLVTGTKSTDVILGNGMTDHSYGLCRHVTILLPGMRVTADFFPLELGSTDVILGMAWLQSLGDMYVNWRTLTMAFTHGEERVVLRGEPRLRRSESSLRALTRSIPNLCEGFVVMFASLAAGDTPESQVHPDLAELLEQYSDMFSLPPGLPPLRDHEHQIVLKSGTEPISVRPYRYPQFQKNEIEKLVGEMLEAGIIRPSTSPFSSPVLLVKKKDGSWRFCVDYRALNKATVLDKFPIPVIDELLDELHGAGVFSKLDLKSGYHQIRMKETDVYKTAFRTHEGHYEFMVMPFGLTNAPSTFQSLMNRVFCTYLRKFVLVFFDDILVYSRDLDEHKGHLTTVFDCLRKEGLFCNRKKCIFGQARVEYLGHIVSNKGVRADPSKIDAMTDWPTPRNLRELRGFLGLTGYYRKFVKNYGLIARGLTELLKKDNFHWGPEAEEAFSCLKKAMTTVPVLALPDFNKPFVLETDASGYGIGAVLMQEGRPIAFFSQSLGVRAQSKSVYERELMAIVLAVQKWRPYLLGRPFRVITDQRSLKYLLEQRAVPGEHQKWIAKLSGYEFEIIYRPGRENGAADALSREGEAFALCDLSLSVTGSYGELLDQLQADPEIVSLRDRLQASETGLDGYRLVDGTVLYEGRIVLPRTSDWIPRLFKELHGGVIGGHGGTQKTYHKIAAEFFWVGMRRDIARMVAECSTCQRHKYSHLSPGGLLQPLELPSKIWEDLTMDFVEGLPKSEGFTVIMVVVDRLSKSAHFVALKHPFTAASVATVFIREIVRLHGIPRSIVSDRDKVFVSRFWREIFRYQGTELKRSTAYHPQTDGQTEVVNRSLETYLRCFTSARPKEWVRWLPWAEYWHNTSYHSRIRMSPFKVLYGRDPPTLVRYDHGSAVTFEVDRYLQERDRVLEELRKHLLKAQQAMKKYEDSKRREVNFDVGDFVYLKFRPYRQKSVTPRLSEKLAPRFYGPFEVLERVGKVAYRLKLPPSSTLHPVFHVSQLKRSVGQQVPIGEITEITEEPISELLQPETVHDVRQNKGVREVLIGWKGLPESESTWEPFEMIYRQFPLFHLEDKVDVLGGVML